MEQTKIKNLIGLAKEAAIEGGKAILKIYDTEDFGVETKGDNSPLTKADKAAHDVIMKHLENTGIPVLSEEGKGIDFSERSGWEYFWLVDPLDGTKEFIKRNGEFTVNIALVNRTELVAGVVYTPVQEKLHWGIIGQGAFLEEKGQTTQLDGGKSSVYSGPVRVVASRSHMSDETLEFINQYDKPEIVSMGSSLKFMVLAEGGADVYPRFGPTMEWDTAAAQAVLEAAGGSVIDNKTNEPLRYNKEVLLNHFFIARAKKED
ncbi:3'(2'),5'-bisphosphate nucleotidase CysQ [Imperialibacter roseus]|uniref:3'(2'),5'-bisphosphate nucleotidase CysQ n=1 Tax=Imperialibacter roseus TaxID=1324217 RepID=A0ABZ0IMS3_9BACT|nr:3'(2'),5'-bisphosphate nucleotidase CysQ [Imperialibacter roseus]WOK06319.1 3'(2'),5'-bisphosphate nucleotidase CysQ [Imperialibacter roseus]|tara:strand:+ start:85319 stop:86101 length:783 start_codon:yes stop_codon:yes gene_type:complete